MVIHILRGMLYLIKLNSLFLSLMTPPNLDPSHVYILHVFLKQCHIKYLLNLYLRRHPNNNTPQSQSLDKSSTSKLSSPNSIPFYLDLRVSPSSSYSSSSSTSSDSPSSVSISSYHSSSMLKPSHPMVT